MSHTFPLPTTAKACITALITCAALPQAHAHTTSVGYVNAGPGSVTFWYGTYHSGVTTTEGSMQVTSPHGYSQTAPFSELVSTKPDGLVDGTNNFYSNGTTLVGTATTTIQYWQGATFSSLTPDDYTFTYVPISTPSSTWQPTDTVILSSSVTVTTADLGGGQYEPNSSRVSQGAAVVLDSLSGSATGDLSTALSQLSALSAEQQGAALQRIAPNTTRAMTVAATQTVNGALDTVGARMAGVRTDGYAVTWEDQLLNEGVQLATDGNAEGIISDAAPRHGVWGKAFGSNIRQKSTAEFAGYKAGSYGLSLGGDTQLRNRWIVGGAFTYATTDVDMTDSLQNNSTDIKTYQLTSYASHDFGRWYLDAMLAYAWQTFDGRRDTGVSGEALSSYKGSQWGLRLMAGVPRAMGERLTMTPLAGLEWNRVRQTAYDETQAGPLSLSVASQTASRVRSAIGVDLASTAWLGHDVAFKPAIHLMWRHEFNNGGVDTTATFSGGGAAFITPGQDLPKNTFNLGATLGFQKTQAFLLTVQLDLERASGYTAKAVQLVGHWRF